MNNVQEEFRQKGVSLYINKNECQVDIVKYQNEPILHLEPYMPYFDDNGSRYYTDTPYLTGEEERIWHRNCIMLDSTPLAAHEKQLLNSAIGKVIDFTGTVDINPCEYDKVLYENCIKVLLSDFERAYEDTLGKPFVFKSCF